MNLDLFESSDEEKPLSEHKTSNCPIHRGNFNVFISLPVRLTKDLIKLQQDCYNYLAFISKDCGYVTPSFYDTNEYSNSQNSTNLPNPINTSGLFLEKQPHISLCKPIFIKFHFIEPLLKNLQSRLNCFPRLQINLSPNIDILANEEFNKFFAAVRISNLNHTYQLLNDMVDAVDDVMQEFGLPLYFKQRILHISLAFTTYDLRPFLERFSNGSSDSHTSCKTWFNVNKELGSFFPTIQLGHSEYLNIINLKKVEITIGNRTTLIHLSEINYLNSDSEED